MTLGWHHGALCVLVIFVGFCRDQLQLELGFSSVDDDGQDVISFVFWIGLDQWILVGRSGFSRLDLMLCVAPTRIVRGFQS